jgi:rhodanese-related sulfurtransferase
MEWREGGAQGSDATVSPRMPTRIEANRLQDLLDAGAQLVEVLPADEYEDEHLPGAISIPLKELDAATTAPLDKANPVVVYCWDYL